MKNRVIQIAILFSFICYASVIEAQENKLFKEYISCFTEKCFTDTYQDIDTIGHKPYLPIKSDYLKFLDKDMQDTTMITWIVYKGDKENYLAILSQLIENDMSYYYYFVFYNDVGKIINSYKILASSEDEYDTKLFLSKDKVKYMRYGPYIETETTNCKEIIYKIINGKSLKQISEQDFKINRRDLFIW